MTEIWKSIERYSCEASSLGRVRNVVTGKILRPLTHTHGYQQVSLRIGEKQGKRYIHRLVCEAFHGPCPDGYECDHRNYDRADNRPDNLSWLPSGLNKAHRRFRRGETNHYAKLTASDVVKICALLPIKSNTAIGLLFGVHRRTIADIRNGVTWQ